MLNPPHCAAYTEKHSQGCSPKQRHSSDVCSCLGNLQMPSSRTTEEQGAEMSSLTLSLHDPASCLLCRRESAVWTFLQMTREDALTNPKTEYDSPSKIPSHNTGHLIEWCTEMAVLHGRQDGHEGQRRGNEGAGAKKGRGNKAGPQSPEVLFH